MAKVVIAAVEASTSLAETGSRFDADKVAALKAAIAGGDYRIDLDLLARAITGFGSAGDCQNFDGAALSEI